MKTKQKPMELLKQFAPEFATHQLDERSLLFEHTEYQAVPVKYKVLTGIAVAAALGSETCTEMWVKKAVDAGITHGEITESIMVARYMKQATVNDTAATSFEWLNEITEAEK
jgi:alkylhydroperoxidase/carboxymuconolactone decarboxylase family protein YurZ